MYRSKLNEKLQESLAAVLPILAIVLILSFTIAPLPTSVLMAFLFGAVLLVVGMMFFSLGAELAMSPMGERVGACITKTRRVGIMLTLGFLLGFLSPFPSRTCRCSPIRCSPCEHGVMSRGSPA